MLLGASVVAAVQHVQIGEMTSLNKHVAFGVMFAAPLTGELMARCLSSRRVRTELPLVMLIAVLVAQSLLGSHWSRQFFLGWPDDRPLVAVIEALADRHPGKPILGEQLAPQRYPLREKVSPRQWRDTYEFSYRGEEGREAFDLALEDQYFGFLWLSMTTDLGAYVHKQLHADPVARRNYRIEAKVPRYLKGRLVGYWLVYAPRPGTAAGG